MKKLVIRFSQFGMAGALAVSVLLAGKGAPPAAAQWSVCNGDPIAWLSNGVKVQMTSVVNVSPALVVNLNYTLHTPPGLTLVRVTDTDGVDASFETVTVIPDSPGGYLVDAVATAAAGGVYPVTLTVHAVNQASNWSIVSGFTGQNLTDVLGV